MTKQKTTKRALIFSVLSLVVCVSMFVGTTFAWFTDSVTSAGNIIKSGSLDVEMYWSDDNTPGSYQDASTGAIFNYQYWEPGYTEVKYIRIVNNGDLALKYQMNIIPDAAAGAFNLADVIDVYMFDAAATIDRAAIDAATPVGTLADLMANGAASGALLPNGGSDRYDDLDDAPRGEITYAIALKMQESADNNYQNLTVGNGFSVQLLATQYTWEEDSFGDDYDTDATYPAVYDLDRTDIDATDILPAGDVAVTLNPGTATGGYRLYVSNKNLETNAAGETTVNYDIDLYKDGVKVVDNGTPYTVAIKVGKDLNITEVLHKGEIVADYDYDPTGEYITFQTTSFSPFAVSYTEYPEDSVYVYTAAQLQAAVQALNDAYDKEAGYTAYANIVLMDDIVFDADSTFMYTEKLNGCSVYLYHANVTLDLNGHNITATSDALMSGKTTATAVFLVRYSNLDIVGEGEIITENQSIAVYGWANSVINIYGGTYTTNSVLRKESAIYVNNTSAKINVYGGTYTTSDFGFNCHNTSCTDVVITLNEGISFYDYQNHFKADFEGGRIALAEGCTYRTTEIDGKILYEIVAE